MESGRAAAVKSARLGLGCLPLGGSYGPVDSTGAVRLIHQALDAGVVLLDAAGDAAGGMVQRIVGRAVAGRRDEVAIAAHSHLSGSRGVAPATPAKACEQILRRIDVDHFDLFYLHLGGSRTPVEETIGTAAALVKAGKVGALGISGISPEQLLQAHTIHPLASLAVEYSLLERGAERELLPLARRLGLMVAAGRPLARGLLTGRITSCAELGPTDARMSDPRFAVDRLASVREVLGELEATAAHLNLGAARLALAWLLSRGEEVLPLPGTSDRVHLEMNLSARRIELSEEVAETLTALFEPV